MGSYTEALAAGILDAAERAIPILQAEARKDEAAAQLLAILQPALLAARNVLRKPNG